MLGTDDKGEPDAPSPAVLAISWPLLAALSICLANARCCSIMCSAKSNTASRTSSGLPGALVVGCDRRSVPQRTDEEPRPRRFPGVDCPAVTRCARAWRLRGAARGRPGVGPGIGAAGPLQHHPADRPGRHGCGPVRHPGRGGRARLRVGADTRRAGAFDPAVRRRHRDLRAVAAQRWTAAAADARPRVPVDRRRRIRRRLLAVPRGGASGSSRCSRRRWPPPTRRWPRP